MRYAAAYASHRAQMSSAALWERRPSDVVVGRPSRVRGTVTPTGTDRLATVTAYRLPAGLCDDPDLHVPVVTVVPVAYQQSGPSWLGPQVEAVERGSGSMSFADRHNRHS